MPEGSGEPQGGAPVDPEGAGPGELVDRLVAFGRLLRQRGLPVGTGRILTFCRAAAALGPLDRDGLYWAGRLTMVARREDIEAYDHAFDALFPSALDQAASQLWAGLDRLALPAQVGLELEVEEAPGETLEPAGQGEGKALVGVLASSAELLRTKSFEELTPSERLLTDALVRRLAVRVPHRRSRRLRPASQGRTFDLRRTLRASLRTEGEPFRRAWRTRRTRARPLVLVLDVSGSMAAYSRALLQFGFAAVRAGQRVEVFCFGTRLTRVTRALATKDPDRALREVSAAVRDWEGGTRIGASLSSLLDRYAQHVTLRGAVVVLCSDGLDRGDPALLAAQMTRLSRLAHRVVWVNPLKGSARYQPLARGMAAALPYVDVFLAGHNVASLEALGEVLATHPPAVGG